MLTHYGNTTGYALLYLLLLFSILLFTGLMTLLAGALGATGAPAVAGVVALAAFWIIGFVVMQRFIAVEGRRPKVSEANKVAVKCVLYFLGGLLAVVLLIALISFLGNLIGGIGGESSGGGESGGGGGKPSGDQKGAPSPEQALQAIKAAWGCLAALLLLYAAPFLNLGILSRFFTPKAKAAT